LFPSKREANCQSHEFFTKTPLDVKNEFPRDIDGTNIGYTGENSERYSCVRTYSHYRLDVPYQVQGDFKETFNMGKFADAEYQQKLPPILASHWNEIQSFQKECYTVTLKVLTLFALALDVSSLLQNVLTISCRTIISPNNILRLTIH
jgi:isopenicillin N synthase-like dioxygenase